jgi:hypothetical protein
VPSETFTHTATADAPVEVVWSALNQAATWEEIGGVDRVFDPRFDPEGRLRGFSFETVAAGRRYVGSAEPHERVEAQRMSWRVSNAEVRGLTIVDLAPAEERTLITVTLEVASAGFLSSVFFSVIAGTIGGGLPRAVEEFAAGLS